MWSVPLRVSCPGPVLRLACLGGGGPVPVPPYLAWGCGGGGWASPGGCPRPRESLTPLRGVVGYVSCLEGGAVRRPRAVHAHGVGTGEGAGWGALDRRLTCTGVSGGPTACALVGWRCSLWGWRKGVPGGVPSTVVRGAWCQALPLPRPLVLRSVQPGLRDPRVPGAVDAGVWTQHRPHSVRPCGPALLAVGVAGGRPRGGCLPPL